MSSSKSSAEPEAVSVTRSAEQQRTEIVNVVVGRARLVVFVVTEERTYTVPVRRQEVRLVYDPVPGNDRSVTSVPPAEEIHEVVLHSEQVQFSRRVVPVERVRMIRHVVRDERTVTGHIRSEQIDVGQIQESEGDASWD
jgi:uncharacterized protein (TIGR02271 family)